MNEIIQEGHLMKSTVQVYGNEQRISGRKANHFLKEIEGRLKQLAAETDAVKKTKFFKEYLETMSKFWHYSYHNQLLIYYQMPTATNVAGYRTWKQLNRWVKKGSKAIKILAPYKKTVTSINPPETDDEKEQAVILFFPVNVFDISQTDGEPLPEIDITIDGEQYKDFLEALVSFCHLNNIKVDFKNLGINGIYGYSKGGKIAVSNAESVNTQANTIIHEIAHELLHKERKKVNKQRAEIQAEGVTYVVTRHFNLENKSFNYLALYNADYKKIMENLKAIAGVSRKIIAFLERSFPTSNDIHQKSGKMTG